MWHKHRLHSGIFNFSKKHFLRGAKEEIFLENNTGSVFLGFGILCSIQMSGMLKGVKETGRG